MSFELEPRCDECTAPARWSIADLRGQDGAAIVAWMACGRHLHRVLDKGVWEVDTVHLYDLSIPVGES